MSGSRRAHWSLGDQLTNQRQTQTQSKTSQLSPLPQTHEKSSTDGEFNQENPACDSIPQKQIRVIQLVVMIPKQGSKWNTKLGGYAQRPLPENTSLFQGDHLISSHLIACKDNEIWFL
jgi:hypothetical protein